MSQTVRCGQAVFSIEESQERAVIALLCHLAFPRNKEARDLIEEQARQYNEVVKGYDTGQR